jgi:hypothetical protein
MGLALKAPPASMPPAAAWPVFDLRPEPGTRQPRLPWASRPQPPIAATASGTRPGAATAAVRVVANQTAWPREPASRLPDPAASCLQLTQVILEVRQGRRRVQQLHHWFSDEALTAVSRGCRRAGPAAAVRLGSLHLQFPVPLTVEAVAIYRVAGRTEAMALRLEAHGTRWLCTAYEAPTRSRQPNS